MSKTFTSHADLKQTLDYMRVGEAVKLQDDALEGLNWIRNIAESDLEIRFVDEVLKQKEKFYIIRAFNILEPSIALMSSNFKGYMSFAIHTTDQFRSHYDSVYILDLLHLHSFQKGEGRKLLGAFKEIQASLHIPGSVWTETEEVKNYYEQHGFVNLGKLGANGEYLMKLPIIEGKKSSWLKNTILQIKKRVRNAEK